MQNQLLMLMISQLDIQIKEWQSVKNKYAKPKGGWIKTLRIALGMSAEQLADRLGLTRGRIVQLEAAESNETVTLKTLNEAASALGCELIYAIVPKHNGSLKDIIETRAEQVSKDQVARVAHSMSLEAQTVNVDSLKMQQELLKRNLTNQLSKKLWESSSTPNKLAKVLYEQLLKHNEPMQIEQNLKNDPEFISYIKKALIDHEKNINKEKIQNKFNDLEYMKALQHALVRYSRHTEKNKKENDLLEKLIETLKKKNQP